MQADDTKPCPVCRKRADIHELGPFNLEISCPCCGRFRVTDDAFDQLSDPKIESECFKISAYLRERTISKKPIITVYMSQKKFGEKKKPAIGIDEIISSGFPNGVFERMDRALKNIFQMSKHPGDSVDMEPDTDYPALFSENENAFYFMVDALRDEGWLKPDQTASYIELTAHGWNRIAELEREKGRSDSNQAFVAMWFDKSLDKVYQEGIRKAISELGFNPIRVDLKEHNGKICDAIIAEIRKSRFVVADFTDHRGGVYFEAGFAKGLGLEVIWTCRESDIEKSHFDTRQYNHIAWKNEKDLYEKLRRRIEATII